MKDRLPASLRDGQYSEWNALLAARYPLSLSEILHPSVPLHRMDTSPMARWGIECNAGWRKLIERFLERFEAAIRAETVSERHRFRIEDIKEKFGRLTIYLASAGTPEMIAAIQDASDESTGTCDVCSAPGQLADRNGWFATRCPGHERWTRWDRCQ